MTIKHHYSSVRVCRKDRSVIARPGDFTLEVSDKSGFYAPALDHVRSIPGLEGTDCVLFSVNTVGADSLQSRVTRRTISL